MDYEKGQPKFSVSKPKKIYQGPMLEMLQDTERFISQFKLDEHRGHLCHEKGGAINFYSYRGGAYDVDEELQEIIRSSIPECSVLDSGFLKLKKLGDKPYLYSFDILVLEGEKVWNPLRERLTIMSDLFETQGRFLCPLQVKNFVEEFALLAKGESKLARKMAKLYNIKYELLEPLIEGFVIKDLDGKHEFPQSVKKTNNQYKLRLQDMLKG